MHYFFVRIFYGIVLYGSLSFDGIPQKKQYINYYLAIQMYFITDYSFKNPYFSIVQSHTNYIEMFKYTCVF